MRRTSPEFAQRLCAGRQAYRRFARVGGATCSASCCSCMVALNVVNAVGRYAFGIVFIGADEVLVFAHDLDGDARHASWSPPSAAISRSISWPTRARPALTPRACRSCQHAVMIGGLRLRGACSPSPLCSASPRSGRPAWRSAFRWRSRIPRWWSGFGGTASSARCLLVRDARAAPPRAAEAAGDDLDARRPAARAAGPRHADLRAVSGRRRR